MNQSREHLIRFAGLKDGLHEFEFQIDMEFFGSFHDEEVLDSDIVAVLTLNKKPEMLELLIQVHGTMHVECDRCSNDLELNIDGQQRQVFKVGEREQYDNEEIHTISPNEYEIATAGFIYECIKLAVPLRRVHKKKNCDPVAIAALEEVSTKDEPNSDPRWEASKAL